MEKFKQLSFFPSDEENAPLPKVDHRAPETVTWNLIHGCNRYVEDYIIGVMRFYPYVKQYR